MIRCSILAICLAAAALAFPLQSFAGDMPDEVKKEFNRLIASSKPEERAQAISLLSQADDAKAFKFLADYLDRDQDEKVLEAAFAVMKGFKDKKVMEAVCKLAPRVKIVDQRVGYVKVLWEYDSEKAFDTLLKFVNDPAWEVRMTLADCLGETAKKKDVKRTITVIDRLLVWVFSEADGRTQNRIRAALYYLTGKDYGLDKDAWKKWWDHEKPLFGKPKEKAEETGPADKDKDGKPDMTTEEEKPPPWSDPVAKEDPTRPRPKFFGHELKNAHVTFVIDVSGSMGEAAGAGKTKLDVVKDELIKTIKAFDKRYWFNMYFYSDFCSRWKDKLQKATEENKTAAMNYVRGLGPMKMTNISYALRKAADDPDTDTIILLSDGKPTVGITDTTALLQDVRKWNKFKKIKISTVGMAGCDPAFLQELARQNGGSYSNAP
jgi:hypothetical protein